MVSKTAFASLLFKQKFYTAEYPLFVQSFFKHPAIKLILIILSKNTLRKMAIWKYGMVAPLFVTSFFKQYMLKLQILMLFKKPSEMYLFYKFILIVPVFLSITILSSFTRANESESFKKLKLDSERAIRLNHSEINVTSELFNKEYLKTEKDTLVKPKSETNEPIFTAAEQNPEFKGGISAMYRFLSKNIIYPKEAQQNNIQGRVYVKFIIEKDGTITEVKILKGIGFGCDEEAKRVISSMPKWNSGFQNGKPVRVYYNMPVVFTMENSGFRKKRSFLIPNFEKNKGLGFFKTEEKINWKSNREVYLRSFNSHTHKTLTSNNQNFFSSRVQLNPANVVESQNSKQVIGALVF